MTKNVLPDHTTIKSLTNTFGKYFADKIAKLRSGLLSTDADFPIPGSYKNRFVSFWTMSEDKVLKIGISNENQSACRVFHSTETALLKIQNNIATSMDKGAGVGLVLLDLSAAFDTIVHLILFNCL